MKRRLFLLLLTTVLLLGLSACNDSQKETLPTESEAPAETVTLNISAAISLTDALDELMELYKEVDPAVSFETNYGASGTLQTQIEEGAPADLFLSAGKKQMDSLEEKELLAPTSRVELLFNKEVLIAPKDSKLKLDSFEDLAEAEHLQRLALGDPESVPAGRYATDAITFYDLTDALDGRIVYASNVRQVLDWVANGDVDAGVVYLTDAMTEEDTIDILLEIPQESHKPIVYPASVIASSENIEAAQAFLDWLQTEEAGTVFEKYGFVLGGK